MSIWSSCSHGIKFPYRDNYSGEPIMPGEHMVLDVAVSPGYQDNVRLSVWCLPAAGHYEWQLAPAEVTELIRLLQRALTRLEQVED